MKAKEDFTGSQEVFEDKNDENCEETDEVSGNWSLRSIFLFSLLCSVNFTEFLAYSILTSFFPVEALKMGASKFVVGVIFSSYALVGFIGSPLVALLIPKFGFRMVILTGLAFLAVGQFSFMFATMFTKGAAFVGYTLITRFISAAGAITCDTAVFSLSTREFSNVVAFAIGMLEVFTGLGLGIGPLIGGYLFTVVGFKGPFIGITCLVLLEIILAYIFIPVDEKESKEEKVKLGPFKQALGIVHVLFGAEYTVVTMVMLVALEPIFSSFAERVLHINVTIIGAIFGVLALLYLLTTVIVGKLADKTKQYLPLMVGGFLVMAVGYFFIGPAPFLTFAPIGKLWLVIVSMVVIGSGSGFAFIPCLPFMMHSATNNGMPDNIATSAVISGIFLSSGCIGQFLAPLASAALFQELAFPWTTAIFGFVCLAQVLLTSIYGLWSRVRSRKSKEKGGYQHLDTEEQ